MCLKRPLNSCPDNSVSSKPWLSTWSRVLRRELYKNPLLGRVLMLSLTDRKQSQSLKRELRSPNRRLLKIGHLWWVTLINVSTRWSVNSKNKTKPTAAVSSDFQLLTCSQYFIVDGKLNDHDEAIRKLQSDIKLLKMSRPRSEAKDGAADAGMSGD